MTIGISLIARFKPGNDVPVYATGSNIAAGHFVTISGRNAKNAYVGAHTGAGLSASGVAERDCIAGVTDHRGGTNIARRGAIARVVAGAAVTAGDLISSDSTGRGITATAQSQSGTTPFAVTAGTVVLGRALQAAAAAGDIIDVDLY